MVVELQKMWFLQLVIVVLSLVADPFQGPDRCQMLWREWFKENYKSIIINDSVNIIVIIRNPGVEIHYFSFIVNFL